MAHQILQQESPEETFAREMMQVHGKSIVRLRLLLHNKHGVEEPFLGTGFVVFADNDLCLIMSCGHNFEGYGDHSTKDAIYAVFGTHELKAELIFTNVEKEVSMIKIHRNQKNNSQFSHACTRSVVHWSVDEAPIHELVAILSYMYNPEGNPIKKPSVYYGTVIRDEGVIKFGSIAVKHNVTADYACTQGNSGSPIVNKNGVVGIHMGGTAQKGYFISLSGVKAVLKEEVAKTGQHNLDSIPDLIGRIAQMEKAKLVSAAGQSSGGGKGPRP